MKPLITVIIPAYNAHDTIQAAIQSIYNTNYDNLEILISDDNSDIGYKYLFKTYPDIKIIRSNINFGAGVARQKAIDIAKGDFICFLDADDLLESCIFIDIDENILKEYDIISHSIYHKHLDEKEDKTYPPYDIAVTHGKIFKTSFLKKNNLRFDPKFRYYEDSYFVRTCVLHTNKIKYNDKVGYILHENKQSTTGVFNDYLAETRFENIDAMCTIAERYYKVKMDDTKLFNFYQDYILWLKLFDDNTKLIDRIFDSLNRIFGIEYMDKKDVIQLFKKICKVEIDFLLEKYIGWYNNRNIPYLSIIIPTYNSHEYIKHTLDALYDNIGNNIDDIEVIITDDNSNNPYYSYLLKDHKNLKILNNITNVRMGMNRNRGLNIATGKWVTFLDHDDILEKKAIDDIMSKKYDKDYVNIIRGLTRNIVDDDSTNNNDYTCIELIHGTFYRRDFLNKNNIKFSDKIITSEDSYFNRKAFITSAFCYGEESIVDVDDVYYYWNIHNESTMHKLYNDRQYEEEFYQEYVTAILLAYKDDNNIPEELRLSSYIRLIYHAEYYFNLWESGSKNYRRSNLKILCSLLLILEEKYNVNKNNLSKWISNNYEYYLKYFPIEVEFFIIDGIYKYCNECYKLLDTLPYSKKKELRGILP